MADIRIVAEIVGNAAGMVAAVGQAETALGRLESSANKVGSAINVALAAGAVAAATALAGGLATAVTSAMGFEKQMSAVGAVAGATAQEMQSLTSLALQLGKDTSFSAKEAAVGLEELVKAGVSISDVMGGAGRAALDLAAAGAISVGDAAEIASNAMNVFGIKGTEMAHVADVIAGAANASAIGVNDYKFSLSAAGAVAATVGISFESLSTAIAVMGQAGIKGSDAGTSLKTMMMNLIPTTEDQIKTFSKLGILTFDTEKALAKLAAAGITPVNTSAGALTDALVRLTNGVSQNAAITPKMWEAWNKSDASLEVMTNSFFDAAGNAKSFAEISEVLKTSLAGMTKEQQLATLEVMFGSDAIRAGAVLLKAGAAGFDEMATAMGKVTAQKVAEERLNNLAGSLEKLKGSLETGAIILGGMFTPALKGLADAATEHVNAAIGIIEELPDAWRTAGEAFAGAWEPSATLTPFMNLVGTTALTLRSQLGPAITTVSGFITGTLLPAFESVAAPIAAAGAAFLGVVGTAGLVSIAIAGVTAVLGFLLTPIGLVALAAGALAAAWTTNFMGIQEATATAWAAIQPTLAALVDWLGVQIPPVLNWISTVGWPALVAAGQAVGTFITGTLVPALTTLVEWLGPKISAVTTWISETGWPALVTAGEAVGTMVGTVITFFQDLYIELDKRGVFEQLGAIWNTLVDIGGRVWDMLGKIAAALAPVFEWVGKLVAETMLPTLVGLFGFLGEKAGAAGGPVTIVAGAIDSMTKAAAGALGILDKMLITLQKISEVKITLPSFGFGAPTGGAPGLQMQSYTGGPSNEEKLGRAAQIGLSMGFTPTQMRAMQGTLLVEGGLQGAVGDSGKSHGPFQLYEGGQFQGFKRWLQENGIQGDPKELAKDIDLATRYALGTYYGAALRQGPQSDASALATYAQTHAQVSINPWKAGQAAPAQLIGAPAQPALSDMQRIPLSGAPGATPDQWPGFMNQVEEQLPAYLMSLDTIQGRGAETFASVLDAGVQAGGALVTASTDSMGNVTRIYSDATGVIGATVTDAAGVIVNAWGGMAASVTEQTATLAVVVPEQTNLMAAGALTSVTNMGTGILTSVTETSGTTIATMTDLNGQVTSQIAQMANGAVLQANGMQAGVMTSVTQMHDGTITSVQDMSGNTIVTVTDMHGNVTSQYAAMASEAGGKVAELASTTEQEMGTIASAVTKPIGPIDSFKGAVASMQPPQSAGFVREFGKIGAAASDAASKIKRAADAAKEFGGSGEKSGDIKGANPLAKRHSGGPVEAGTAYLVGREGAEELFVPRQSGYVHTGALLPAERGNGSYDGPSAREIARELAAVLPKRGDINFNGLTSDEAVNRLLAIQRQERLMERIQGR